jgi:hypothetical protein
VNQDVAHAADGPPIERCQAAPRLGRNPLGRLADHLYVPDDSILKFLGRQERFSAGPIKRVMRWQRSSMW